MGYYDQFETVEIKQTKTKAQAITNIDKYKEFVRKAMDEGLEKYGTKLEMTKAYKINNGKKKEQYLNGYYLIQEHEKNGNMRKHFTFHEPKLYQETQGENIAYNSNDKNIKAQK